MIKIQRRRFLTGLAAVSAASVLPLPALARAVHEHPEFISHEEMFALFGNWMPLEAIEIVIHPIIPPEMNRWGQHEEAVAYIRGNLKQLAAADMLGKGLVYVESPSDVSDHCDDCSAGYGLWRA